jgi:geranylgeranylglycerol-phosphate geranylgeranyltransferase
MIAIAILVGSVIAVKSLPIYEKFILVFCTALFLEASTFALNDYFDLEIDKKNKRTDRPLVRGDLSPISAVYLFVIFFPLGIICSYFVNLTCFVIALITALFALLYDVKLKKIKLIGNFFIAYTMAIPFVFGGAAVLSNNIIKINLSPTIFIVACIAFLAGAGREIMKDVMDFKGDKEKGVKSFPKYIGMRVSSMLAAIFFFVAITLSFLPFLIQSYGVYYQNYYYLLLILITDIILLYIAILLIGKKQVNMKLYRKMTLFALFVGLCAFLLGAYI